MLTPLAQVQAAEFNDVITEMCLKNLLEET